VTEKTSAKAFGNYLDVRKMLTTSPPKLNHVLPGLLEAVVALLAAPGGTGKTMFLLQLAFAIATGESLCGGLFDDVPPECARSKAPGKVVFLAAEESAHLLWHRVHAVAQHILDIELPRQSQQERDALLGHLEQNLRLYPLLGRPRAVLLDSDHEPSDLFNELLEVSKDAKLVILDPLRQFHRGDENDSGNMTAVVQTLQVLAARTGAAVILAHHTNRASSNQGNGDAAGAARGSTALTDGVRWQVNLSNLTPELARDYKIPTGEEGRYVRVNIAKANYLAPYGTRVLQRGPRGTLSLVASPTVTRAIAQKRAIPFAKGARHSGEVAA